MSEVKTTWTDLRVAGLKFYWKDGISATQIAKKLGGVSRNAVLGKVHRLKLETRKPRNAYFYKPHILLDVIVPKRTTRASVFKSREVKPSFPLPNPHAKPGLGAAFSAITGNVISIKKRPRVPEMTKPQLRAMLTQAVLNTGGIA